LISIAVRQLKVELQGEKVLVENEKGDQGTFDRVIVATPTSKLEEFLNPEQFAEDMNRLNSSALNKATWLFIQMQQ
jgi:protoporphyrinogen oxidase